MNVWWILRTEIRRLLRSRIKRAAILAGLVIPLLYSSLYLYAFWDPYNQLDQFPVAIVNQDQGGDHNGTRENYGNEVVDQLVKDNKFHFVPLKADDAKRGLEKGNYYLMISIPPTFTADALSVEGDNPHKAEVTFSANEGANYIASTISARLETSLREELGNKFSKEYLKGIFDVVGDAGNGLSKAAEGATKLANGAATLADGTKKASDGANKLYDGSKQLVTGSAQVADGNRQLSDGIAKADSGAAQLYDGAFRLQKGLSDASGGSDKIASGLTQTTAGVRQVRDQLNGAASGTDKLAAGLGQMQGTLGGLGANGQPNAPTTQDPAKMPVLDMMGVLAQTYSGLAQDPLYQGILLKINGVSGGLATSAQSVRGSADGLGKAVAGLDQIATSQDQMVNGAKALAAGNKQMLAGATSLQGGLNDLHAGTSTMASKSAQLAVGAQQVANGNADLSNGARDLADGNAKLKTGSADLASGNRELAGKLTSATADSTIKNPDQKADVMSDPVVVNSKPIHPVATYGMGFASYFIPLSLWVGALMLYFILSMKEYRWTLAPVSSASIVLGKFGTLGLIGVLQAVISSLVLTEVLGLQVMNLPEFYLFNILIALTSIALIGLLIAVLGSGPGRFVSILLLILQLTSSAGTFPIELVPSFFRTIHPFLPMSYGIEALRALIATGDQSVIWRSIGVITSILVAALLLQILTTRRTLKVGDLHERDSLVA